MIDYPRPLLGFAAFSGTGKTTLLKRLIPLLNDKGLRVGLIKHAHHDVEFDTPGKDSYELRKAGASPVLLSSARRWALMVERDNPCDPILQDEVWRFDPKEIDLLLVEGFRHEAFAKIELHRPLLGKPLLFPDDPHIVAIATDEPLSVTTTLPFMDLNDHAAIAGFILNNIVGRSGVG
ncbi:MAG TPA: molybdopterin-guanine dinucleotide biosynthesis protein B [Chromatiales bacterium]|nr:molybdopterin-guanine dinucleotide biosynthesis protein B [Chromatiales bacterium]